MKGLYFYCVRPRTSPAPERWSGTVQGKEKTNSEFPGTGLKGGKIWTLPYKDLEAVVSEVSLEEFGSKKIQKKAQEDLGWIKEKVQIHEKVIEEAMGLKFPPFPISKNPLKSKGLKTVIPMKFGTIFKTEEKVRETLRKYYPKFKEDLRNLMGKQEWSVKVYLNRKAFEKEIKKVSPVVQEKEKEIASLPEGMAYFMQKQIDEAAFKEADKALENYTKGFFENLKKYATTGTKGKILEKELTGKSLPMVLNAIFLISEEKLKDFVKEVNKLTQEYKSKGFNFEHSGPWPPYNFI